jgi:hypothetical protein
MTVVAVVGCERIELPLSAESRPTATPALLVQWAVEATASSHYALPDWSPRRATGEPEVPACADDARAWASARGNTVEWLELTYAEPVFASEVRIYQTYGRGAISRVTLIDESGDVQLVWEGVDETSPCPGYLSIIVNPMETRVNRVRVDLDESRTDMWNQIDAVALVGLP